MPTWRESARAEDILLRYFKKYDILEEPIAKLITLNKRKSPRDDQIVSQNANEITSWILSEQERMQYHRFG
jgi:hypothetical protein